MKFRNSNVDIYILVSFCIFAPNVSSTDVITVEGNRNKSSQTLDNNLIRKERFNDQDNRFIFLDYIIVKRLENNLDELKNRRIIQLSGEKNTTIFAVLENYISDTEMYQALAKKVADQIGVCSVFNRPVLHSTYNLDTTIILTIDLSHSHVNSFVKATVEISPPSYGPQFGYISLQPQRDSVSKAPLDDIIYPNRVSKMNRQSRVFYESFAAEGVPMNTFKRKKRQEPSDTTLFMDYIVIKELHKTLTAFEKMNIIKLNNTVSTMLYDLLDQYAAKTEFYLLLTKKIEDEIGACDFLATPRWWRIKIPVPDSDDKVRILDLMLKTLLRYSYKWLCENHYIITKKSPNELAAIGLEITKEEDFYRILTEGESEITDFEKNLSRHNWWLEEGEIEEENGEFVWTI